ncbi:MAG: septum formation initiator family protein [Candidatus Pelagibacter sp.]
MLKNLKNNYFSLVSIFLILYFFFNLMSGDRGLISYFDKKQILINLQFKELKLLENIEKLEFNNSLLSDNLDLDFVETLIRERFLFGKKNDKIYIINNNEN